MPKVRLRDLNPAIFLNKVGIGTDDPAELLDVVGGNVRIGKTTNGRLIIENSSGTVKVQLDSNGNSYINGGKVGIGTGSTAPVNKLQIVGGTSITDGGAASPAASDGLHLMFDTATKVSWIKSEKLNTSNRGLQFLASQYIFNTGNVGIGTGTNPPEVLLHCSGGANEAGLRLGRSSGLLTDGTTYIGSLEFQDDTTNPPVKLRAVRTGSGGAAAMTFETGDATNPAVEAMRITSSGVVKLNQEAESEIAFRRNNTGTAMDCGKITFGDNTDARAQIQGETTTTSDDGELTFSTADSGTLTEAMRITSDGNVLVGAAPKIHANSTAAYYTNQAAGKTILSTFDSNEKVTCDATGYMEFETDGVAALRIDSSQNVGIGTASPAQRLHVYDADYAYARFSTSEFSTGLDVGINDDLNEAFIRMRENTPLTFWTNNVERMTIDSGGQVSQPVETLTTDDTVDIDFSKSNLQTFTLDGSESQTELTGSNYAAGRTVRLMIDMSSDGHMGGITTPSNWTNFGDDPASISSAGLVLCELTSWTAAEGGVTARWSESTV